MIQFTDMEHVIIEVAEIIPKDNLNEDLFNKMQNRKGKPYIFTFFILDN